MYDFVLVNGIGDEDGDDDAMAKNNSSSLTNMTIYFNNFLYTRRFH